MENLSWKRVQLTQQILEAFYRIEKQSAGVSSRRIFISTHQSAIADHTKVLHQRILANRFVDAKGFGEERFTQVTTDGVNLSHEYAAMEENEMFFEILKNQSMLKVFRF